MLIGVALDPVFAYGVGLGGCVPVIPVRMDDHLVLRGCAERSAFSHDVSFNGYECTY